MSATLFDSVARIARHEASARPTVSIGVVVDTFDGSGAPADHAVSVELREAGIVLPRVPLAVGALGFAALPAPGDLVVVAFADGDHHAPVVVGRLYNSDLEPPPHGEDEVVLHLPPGASTPEVAATIRPTEPTVRLQVGADVEIEVAGDAIRLTAGDATALVEATGGGRTELTVGDATLAISGRGDIEISTSGKFTVQATEVDIQGSASATVTAPQVKVN